MESGALDLIAAIREKKARFDKLAEELAILRKELEEARALLNEQRQTQRRGRISKRKGVPARPIKSDSSVGLALNVLQEIGRPLHADELIRQIEKLGHAVNKGTLVGQLTRYFNKGVVFTRPEPNTFGLKEWDLRVREKRTEGGG